MSMLGGSISVMGLVNAEYYGKAQVTDWWNRVNGVSYKMRPRNR